MPYKPIYNVSSTASREFLRKPRDSPNVFGNACNGVANTGKFFVRLATVLQTPKSFSWDLQQCCKRQKVFCGTCNGVANARKFFVGLATVLQTPESFSWDLQQCCKHQKVFRRTCNGVANAEKFFVGLATVLQRPKSFSRHLQHFCKRQKVSRGVCSIPANVKANAASPAKLPQGALSSFRQYRRHVANAAATYFCAPIKRGIYI